MLKNIAVILRGHARIWPLIYKNVFAFYESISENVDYYWLTWETDYEILIKKTFDNKNLKAFETFPTCQKFQTSWRSPAFFNYMALPFLKQSNTDYDMIFDSRPDVLNRVLDRDFYHLISKENKVYVTQLETHYRHNSDTIDVAISDHFILFPNIEIIEKLSYRMYSHAEDYGNQICLRELIEKNHYGLQVIRQLESKIMRPTLANYLDKNGNFETDNAFLNWSQQTLDWQNMLPDDKIDFCKKLNITPSDYYSGDISRPHSLMARIW